MINKVVTRKTFSKFSSNHFNSHFSPLNPKEIELFPGAMKLPQLPSRSPVTNRSGRGDVPSAS